MANQLLSEDDYINLLQLRFNNPEIKFEKAEWKSLAENLDGFLGDHNILQIWYSSKEETKSSNFFVKSKPELQSSADTADKLLVYEKEIFFYDKLMREFDKHGCDISFAPKMFLCKNNEVIIMNDLKSEGFYLSGRTNFYDLIKIKSALKALAYFHGASFIYEEEESFRLGSEFPDKFIEKFLDYEDPDSIGYQFHRNSLECFVKIIDVLDETQEWKTDFKHRLTSVNYLEIFRDDSSARKAVGHGDLWANNMLFKQHNGEVQCCIIDYQVLRYMNPAFDVLYLIYVNTRRQFRDANIKQLLDYYYDCLTEVLSQKELLVEDIYSKEDLLKGIEHFKFLARFDTACSHTFTFLDISKLKKVIEDKSLEDLINKGRSSLVIEGYKHDKLFRGLMTENLYEMRDLLFQQ